MCGIYCAVSCTRYILPSADLEKRLHNRGPDSSRTIQMKYSSKIYHTSTPDVHLTFSSTVLSLRGSRTVTQPYQDDSEEYTLCWNGEAWSIAGETNSGNDTEAVYRLLVDAVKTGTGSDVDDDPTNGASNIARALSHVSGPYAFVFFDRPHGHVFFGRDFLGRRSLLNKSTKSGEVVVASVSAEDPRDGWVEVEADGVYCIDLSAPASCPALPGSQTQKVGSFMAGQASYHFTQDAEADTGLSKSVIPRLSLNKSILPRHLPLTTASLAVANLETCLRESLALRVLNIPDPPSYDNGKYFPGKARLAILFSGGLDCTVLARLSHELLPASEPIDLLNVAFENPRIHKEAHVDPAGLTQAYELCPDRITGRTSYAELVRTSPARDWRFVAINVPYAETSEHRKEIISLMYPHNTEMDLSIACALYFAARGRGQIQSSASRGSLPYTTSARVLLSGLGADELFGGYTRHATAFRRGGYPVLLDELELDVSRLGKRNLGRDDRVMPHWGREVRFPYLEEKLLSWALNVSLTEKCGFGEAEVQLSANDEGCRTLEPGKKVLRCLASRLGLEGVAREKKRAIQFGARTAKMEAGKTKGTQLLS
ncbi:hypothetical protein LTR37_000574 [Vermiconidia calcicola]|uniref:Uncharacterized protein n=1 Tax=Vermiconidia calcicola TaxID=1690605 RepID=A0ACC3NZG4_9PEZI|nr:hypothetical protein LTR37_000574 [Vermiconidia calcicola]